MSLYLRYLEQKPALYPDEIEALGRSIWAYTSQLMHEVRGASAGSSAAGTLNGQPGRKYELHELLALKPLAALYHRLHRATYSFGAPGKARKVRVEADELVALHLHHAGIEVAADACYHLTTRNALGKIQNKALNVDRYITFPL